MLADREWMQLKQTIEKISEVKFPFFEEKKDRINKPLLKIIK